MIELNIWQQVIVAASGAVIAFIINEYVRDNKAKRGLASALCSELKSAKELYLNATNGGLKSWDETDLLPFFVIEEKYFGIYDENADKLCLFSRSAIDKIVRTYGKLKGFLENLRYWSICRERFNSSTTYYQTGYDHPDPYISYFKEQFPAKMIEHYEHIRAEQEEVLRDIDIIIDLLHGESECFGIYRKKWRRAINWYKQIRDRQCQHSTNRLRLYVVLYIITVGYVAYTGYPVVSRMDRYMLSHAWSLFAYLSVLLIIATDMTWAITCELRRRRST